MEVENVTSPTRVRWENATGGAKFAYKHQLSEMLSSLPMPDSALCDKLHCCVYKENIEICTIQVLEAIETATENTLPKSVSTGTKVSRIVRVFGIVCGSLQVSHFVGTYLMPKSSQNNNISIQSED